MRYVFRFLKYFTIIFVSIITLLLIGDGIYELNMARKYSTMLSIDITRTQAGCEEGCNDYEVRSINSPEFKWLVGKTVDIKQYSDAYRKGLPQSWYDEDYKVFCVTGKLHKVKDDFLWFWPRNVYNFTGSAVHPGMCSNPKAKRFKG